MTAITLFFMVKELYTRKLLNISLDMNLYEKLFNKKATNVRIYLINLRR